MNPVQIDLAAKETEYEWTRTLDDFWKKVGPQWFQWLEWMIILGALDFAASDTESTVLRLATGLSYGILWLYLSAVTSSVEWRGWQRSWPGWARRIVSSVLSALLMVALSLLLTGVARDIQGRL